MTSVRHIRHAALAISSLLTFAALAVILAGPALAAEKGVIGYIGNRTPPGFGEEHHFGTGHGGGELYGPRGVDINVSGVGGVSPGEIYIADTHNQRIDLFSPSAAFDFAFGYDDVVSGADNSAVNAQSIITVEGTGGVFWFRDGGSGSETSYIPYDASAKDVETAINELYLANGDEGTVSVTGGYDESTSTGQYTVSFDGGLYAGNLHEKSLGEFEALSGPTHGIHQTETQGGGFEICKANPPSNDVCQEGPGNTGFGLNGSLVSPTAVAINQSNGDVYSVGAGERVAEFSATGAPLRSFGQAVVASGPDKATPTNAVQTLTVTATTGKYTLAFGGKTTAPLAFNAPATGAASVQEALEGLPSIGNSNVSVKESSSGVYAITFSGQLADNPEPTIAVASDPAEPLSGGSASVASTTKGVGSFDICESANGDVCQTGEQGGGLGGAFHAGGTSSIVVAPPVPKTKATSSSPMLASIGSRNSLPPAPSSAPSAPVLSRPVPTRVQPNPSKNASQPTAMSARAAAKAQR